MRYFFLPGEMSVWLHDRWKCCEIRQTFFSPVWVFGLVTGESAAKPDKHIVKRESCWQKLNYPPLKHKSLSLANCPPSPSSFSASIVWNTQVFLFTIAFNRKITLKVTFNNIGFVLNFIFYVFLIVRDSYTFTAALFTSIILALNIIHDPGQPLFEPWMTYK